MKDISTTKSSTRQLLRTLWTVPIVLALAIQAQAAMVMSPYLQAVTTDSVYVMVECDSQNPVTVQYGPDASYGKTAVTASTIPTEAKPATYVHRVKLTGLKANATYHYRATQDKTNYTRDYTFATAVLPGTQFRFAALADFRTNTAVHEKIVAKIKTANPRFSIYGGDLCGDSSYRMFKKEFFQPNELALGASVPWFNAPGNHEGWSADTKAFTQSPAAPAGAQGYYSFDYGDAHFVSINNQVPYGEDSAQWKFVKEDLAATKKTWKIVFFHEPAYCAGGHNENKTMIAMTTKIFEPNKVDLVITGHTHFYQHNLVNGINHFVLGSAGAPLYDLGTKPYVVKEAKAYHYAIIDVSKDWLNMVVYKDNGTILDTLHLDRSAAKAQSNNPKQTADSWVTTDSGLKYKDEIVGTGQIAKAGDRVTVHYKGWLDNGKVFDSSMKDGREPFQFKLGAGEVIEGWDEGVAGMRVGGTRELTIPSELAYRDQAIGPIPANSTLHFTVKLLSIAK